MRTGLHDWWVYLNRLQGEPHGLLCAAHHARMEGTANKQLGYLYHSYTIEARVCVIHQRLTLRAPAALALLSTSASASMPPD